MTRAHTCAECCKTGLSPPGFGGLIKTDSTRNTPANRQNGCVLLRTLRMKYFLWIDEKQTGPYDQQQIRDMVRAGQISALTLGYAEDGSRDWSQIGSLFNIFPGAPVDTPKNKSKFVTCRCRHCNGHIEFDASDAGATVACPHCGLETVLFIPANYSKIANPPPASSPATPPITTNPSGTQKHFWENWNWGGKDIFAAACVATASMFMKSSMFMKWVDIGFVSQTGLTQETFLLLGLWIYPVFMLFKNKPISRAWGLTCSIASAAFTGFYISSKSLELFGNTINVASTGAWLFLLASIALVVGVIAYCPTKSIENKTSDVTSFREDVKSVTPGALIGKRIILWSIILLTLFSVIIVAEQTQEWSKSLLVQQGNVEISIRPHFAPELGTPHPLAITVTVKNLSKNAKIDFQSWGGWNYDFQAPQATLENDYPLSDNFGNQYRRYNNNDSPPSHSIYPGSSLSEDLIFEPPVNNSQWLHFEISGKNFGGEGMIRFEIPASKIASR
jgi:hypothetical protein